MITYYDVLGVENTATSDEITKSYRKLARTNHPDQGGNSQQFILIGKAYETLSTPESRENYDYEISHTGNHGSYNDASQERETPTSDEYKNNSYDDNSYERDNVRQTPVDWYSYPWFNPEKKYEYKEKVVKPRPYRLRANAESAVYFTIGIFAIITLIWTIGKAPSAPLIFWGLGAIAVQVFAFKFWSQNYFMGWTPMTVASQGIAGIAFTWIAVVAKSNGNDVSGWYVFWVAFLCFITNIECIRSMELHGKAVSERIVFTDKRRLTNAKTLLENNTWGSVADFDDSGFSEKNMFLGTVGEEYTDELTSQFVSIPGVRKFNGLRFLGTQNADLDHAIVLNDTIIFIDSKQWARGKYKWVNDRTVVAQRGNKVSQHSMSFIQSVEKYRKKLPKRCKIHAMVLIHGVGIEIESSAGSCGGVELMNTVEGIDKIGRILTEAADGAEGKVDFNIMNYLIQNTK